MKWKPTNNAPEDVKKKKKIGQVGAIHGKTIVYTQETSSPYKSFVSKVAVGYKNRTVTCFVLISARPG